MQDTLPQEIPVHLRDRRFGSVQDRRKFLATLGLGGLFFTTRGAFAQALLETPAQTLGPYYPDRLPLDRDNDLLIINDNITPGVGRIAWISGKVMDRSGQPVRGVLVEIWQADNVGAYIHSQGANNGQRDGNFQGYGRFVTASSGEYLFRTIKPGLYPGRVRHVHYKITAPGGPELVTQLYIEGETAGNDGVLSGIPQAQRSSVIVPWTAIPESATSDLAARFDIVLGFTASETPTPSRPTIAAVGGVVQGATIAPGAAPGGWVTIFGQGLSPSTRAWQSSDFVNNKLPESLDGVSVRISNKPASVSYVSPKQINAIAPSDVAVGNVQATVVSAAGTSDPVAVEVQSLLPGFFQFGQEYVAAVRADGAYLGPPGLITGVTTVPARPGDQVLLFGTGFGPTTPAPAGGEAFQGAFPLVNTVAVKIGASTADVSYAGLISPGLVQINLTIPDLPDGDHPVAAQVGSVRTVKIGRIRIQRQPTATRRQPTSPLQLARKEPEESDPYVHGSPTSIGRLMKVISL